MTFEDFLGGMALVALPAILLFVDVWQPYVDAFARLLGAQ